MNNDIKLQNMRKVNENQIREKQSKQLSDWNGNYCTRSVFLIRETDEFAASDNTDLVNFCQLLVDENLPEQFSRLIDDEIVEEIAKKPPSYLSSFRYAGPQIQCK